MLSRVGGPKKNEDVASISTKYHNAQFGPYDPCKLYDQKQKKRKKEHVLNLSCLHRKEIHTWPSDKSTYFFFLCSVTKFFYSILCWLKRSLSHNITYHQTFFLWRVRYQISILCSTKLLLNIFLHLFMWSCEPWLVIGEPKNLIS